MAMNFRNGTLTLICFSEDLSEQGETNICEISGLPYNSMTSEDESQYMHFNTVFKNFKDSASDSS